MKRCNLKTFKTQTKTIKSKVKQQLVEMKEEKNLLSRFLIAARKRPELELEKCIGSFEFSVVPKSLFSVDGELLPCNDKAKLMHHIEEMPLSGTKVTEPVTDSVLIIDGMADVNQIHKDHTMKTCKVRNSSLASSSFCKTEN